MQIAGAEWDQLTEPFFKANSLKFNGISVRLNGAQPSSSSIYFADPISVSVTSKIIKSQTFI